MSIRTKISVRLNALTKEKVASAAIVDLHTVGYSEFCDYLAQDSTVGVADVAAVMAQLEKKLPLLLGMGNKVQVSQGGMTVKPTVSGSLTQSQLKAKLQAKRNAGDTSVDADRQLAASDLTVGDLTAGVAIDFGKKFRSAFADKAEFVRVSTGTAEDTSGDTADSGGTGTSGGGSSSASGGSSSSDSGDGGFQG